MNHIKLYLLGFLVLGGSILMAQGPNKLLIEGDKHYRDSSFQDAEENYRKALELHPDFKTKYNIGNSLYKQGRSKEAIEYYQNSLQQANQKDQLAKAHYNLGNAYFNEQQFDKSLDSYKESLKLNPNDHDARNNLILAKEQLRQQQEQQKQQQKQSAEKEDPKEQKDQTEEQNSEDHQDQQQEKSQPQQNKDQEKKQNEQDGLSESTLNKEQAEQLMKMVGDQDAKIRERLQKANSRSKKRVKDW